MRMFILVPFYSLADVGDCVHPAANANLVANIWRVAELVHDSNVVWIRPLEQLLLQCNRVDLQKQKSVDVCVCVGAVQMKIRNTANNVDNDNFLSVHNNWVI